GKMKENIALSLKIDTARINLKATTTEHLGFCGRGEGIAVQSVVLLK
ncbi:MAG: 2-C-methyl-D-erythritol 2,4-cyclodiphosphate synthase, partial [Actinobacteria bacterium]|nr:2-C-methyl-D-erythritol 2,4-cyclodiphosphate synthase [Actinomycetota bacterium]